MGVRRAVLYCTVNGVCNNTNGLGRQTKTLLSTLRNHPDELRRSVGAFDVHLACPEPGPDTWRFDPEDLEESRRTVEEWGGRVHALPYDTEGEFWSVSTWQRLSEAGARCAAELAQHYDELLVIAMDTPFAGLGDAWLWWRADARTRCRVEVLITFCSTALIVERPAPNPQRIVWERAGVASANRRPEIWVADLGRFLSRHLQSDYGLEPHRLAPYASSLDLSSPDLRPMPPGEARAVVERWEVPLDRPLVITVGRTDPTKGIDVLIHALGPLRNEVHAVIVAVPFDGDDPLIADYARRIADEGLQATLVAEFTRELPRALCALPQTRVVACPSRGETLANVPFETALWAQEDGPLVVAPRRDGFVEQIDDGATGVLYAPDQPGALTEAIRCALAVPPDKAATMRAAAAHRVRAERNAAVNLVRLLRFFWREVSTY
ncbi:glycosyltransferase family 4 protein [Amycolatopsis sp. NPDC059021]|uniref:glycosyltransferase family 4 protein n=1 Tax=Amycolatopsis sp. NPDC059021 TaxID=3346704 RepID=UPI0036733BCF